MKKRVATIIDNILRKTTIFILALSSSFLALFLLFFQFASDFLIVGLLVFLLPFVIAYFSVKLFEKYWANKLAKKLETERFQKIGRNISDPRKNSTNTDYQTFRKAQADWLEQHYDLNSLDGIRSIPVSSNLPKYPTSGSMDVTGDLDYYLRQKAHEHETNGNIDLAIECLKKSNEIRYKKKSGYRKDDYYSLVRILARNGRVSEAQKEKAKIDKFFGSSDNDALINSESVQVKRVLRDAKAEKTDLVIMNAHGCACSECAKYQGRVFSLSGQSKIYPKIPDAFFIYGGIHKGCGHSFYPFNPEYTDPDLNYTLQFYKGLSRSYSKNIVAFSNRPFVDDRAPEDIAAAVAHHQKLALEAEKKRLSYEHIIETEAQRGEDSRTFAWIQNNLPNLCPKSLSGFRRMKNQNTKNYQKIVQAAAEKGYTIK